MEVIAVYVKTQCCKHLPGGTGIPHETSVMIDNWSPDLQNTTKNAVLCHAVTYGLSELTMVLKLKEVLYKSNLDNSITVPGC
jgi:hypothetical protein